MVGIGTGLVALALIYWLRPRRTRMGAESRLTLLALAATGPLAFLANELGWLVSEFGRQPWIVYGVFRTTSTITTSPGLGATFSAFTLLYLALTALTIWGSDASPQSHGKVSLSRRLGPHEMSLAAILATLLGLSLTAPAIFAGADFGAGVLDLLAGPRPDARAAIADTIGPLWEANHVWLIFSITLLFPAFPAAFAALGTALLAPLTITLLVLVLRAASLGLRSSGELQSRGGRRLSRLFGITSVIAPFLFGAVAGGVAEVSGSGSPAATTVLSIPWTGLLSLLTGTLAVALCTQLAAGFMALRMARTKRSALATQFRRRGLQSAVATLASSAMALIVASWKTPALSHQLLGPALPMIIAGFAATAASVFGFSHGPYRLARGAAVLSTVAILWGWIIAQSPHLIGSLTIHAAAANRAALTAVAVAVAVTLVTVLPAMFLLFGVSARAVSKEI